MNTDSVPSIGDRDIDTVIGLHRSYGETVTALYCTACGKLAGVSEYHERFLLGCVEDYLWDKLAADEFFVTDSCICRIKSTPPVIGIAKKGG